MTAPRSLAPDSASAGSTSADAGGGAGLRIGVTGATGFIGPYVVEHLLDAGVAVRTFTRRSWSGAPHVPLVDRRLVLLPGLPDERDLADLDALIHLAVAPHDASARVVHAVNTTATVELAERALSAGVPRFVFVSTQSAHDGARNLYGRSKRAAEIGLEGLPGVVVVRPGLVYDDEGGGLLGLASTIAAKARVFPVIGGADSVAQPVHVGDLAAVLLQLATAASAPALVEVASPKVFPLADLVVAATRARFGVRPRPLSVPLRAARVVASAGAAVKVGAGLLEVVRGIEGFRVMDTAAQLDALGISLRSFNPGAGRALAAGAGAVAGDRRGTDADAGVKPTVRRRGGVAGLLRSRTGAPDGAASLARPDTDARRLLLVGSGRIGSVHAMCAQHHPDAVVCGVVEPSARNAKQVQALLGLTAPRFRSLDEALAAVAPTAAVVATPPHTHAPLAEALLAAGVHVVVEKPVTPDPAARERLLAAARAAGDDAECLAGYQMVHLPYVQQARELLHSGAIGTVESFVALAFVARAEPDAGGLTWELDPARAGGGALPHAAAHVLSLLDTVLGPLELLDGTLVHTAGRGVEDAVWLRLGAGSVTGSLFAGWHLADFVIPENTVRLRTSEGTLVLGQASSVFVPAAGSAASPRGFWCFDDLSAFAPAPVDGGAAYWIEQRAALAGEPGPATLDLAARIERLTDLAHHKAQRVTALVDTLVPAGGAAAEPVPTLPPGTMVDVRRLDDPEGVRQAVVAAGGTEALACSLTQWRALDRPGDALLLVPDAPKAFRLITNRGPLALLPHLGVTPLARSLTRLDPTKALTAHGPIWEGIGTLLRAELARVPVSFRGRLVLDGYLVDLAGATGRLDEVVELVDDLRRRCPHAQVGIETNAPALAPPVLGVLRGSIDLVVTVATPGAGVVGLLRAAAADPSLPVYVRTGPQPPEVVQTALDAPETWLDGGTALVADWRGVQGPAAAFDALLDRAIASTAVPEWAHAEARALLAR